MKDYFFTSESVSHGHPDKICDQISDLILDRNIRNNPNSKSAIEVLVAPRNIIVAGEINHTEISNSELEKLIRDHIKRIGFFNLHEEFDSQTLTITNLINKQSPEIAIGVEGNNEGAGDQGIMFGFACNENKDYMPSAIYYANQILKNIFNSNNRGDILRLGPDAKSQVTLEYKDGVPVRAESIVVSIQHPKDFPVNEVKETIREYVLKSLPDPSWFPEEEKFFVNPTGIFTVGGPVSDAGLTGRKIIVDTYGGAAPHGGGAFSGKDPSKVDRSAAYISRKIAKNIVASGLADKCTIQLSYAIGISKPLSLYVNTHGTGKISEKVIAKKITDLVDLSPRGIKNHLDLLKPIYLKTASYGHFGRKPTNEGHFSWEKTDLAEALLKLM